MARTSHADVMALPDAAQTWNFDLFFPSIPGATDAKGMTIRCKTTSLPGSSIEPVPIELHGVKKQEAGRAQYQHTMTATFMETVSWDTLNDFRRWRDLARSWKRNSGASSKEYKVNLEIDLYDNAGSVIGTQIICGCFIQEINEVQLNGAESQAVEISVTLSFDYIDDGISY